MQQDRTVDRTRTGHARIENDTPTNKNTFLNWELNIRAMTESKGNHRSLDAVNENRKEEEG
jgi:hypothetical protein